jgi:predicted ester cyclase
MTIDEARNLADRWVAAWNAHDLDLIITHYEDTVELTSPVAAQLLGTSDGKVVGKVSLKAYFRRGLEAYPELHFRLADVLCGVNSVVLYYINQKGTRTAEFMELSATGKVARVVAKLRYLEQSPLAIDLFCRARSRSNWPQNPKTDTKEGRGKLGREKFEGKSARPCVLTMRPRSRLTSARLAGVVANTLLPILWGMSAARNTIPSEPFLC